MRKTEAPVRRKDRYHHGDLVASLVEAARALVERDGHEKFSVAEASRMAGVSTAAPYKHFKDRADLLRHVVRLGFQELAEAMREARDANPGPMAPRIAAMGKAYVRFGLSNPGVFRLIFGDTVELKKDGELREVGHDCFNVLIEDVGRGLGGAATDEEAKRLSVMLWTFVHGVASLAMDGDYEAAGAEVDLDALIDGATDRMLPDAG